MYYNIWGWRPVFHGRLPPTVRIWRKSDEDFAQGPICSLLPTHYAMKGALCIRNIMGRNAMRLFVTYFAYFTHIWRIFRSLAGVFRSIFTIPAYFDRMFGAKWAAAFNSGAFPSYFGPFIVAPAFQGTPSI